MAERTPWHIFYNCFQNRATQEELTILKNWMEEDAENIKVLEDVYTIFSLSSVSQPPFMPDRQKAWQKIDQRISTKETRNKSLSYRLRYIAAIASVLLFAVMLTATIRNYQKSMQFSTQVTAVVTQPGQKTNIILPDGSTVWLNSSSSLKYNSTYNIDDREVTMTGEAFFDVRKDQSKTFRVKCNDLSVEVHGTSFNVKNRGSEHLKEVTVSEGKVGLVSNSHELTTIVKGEQAIFDEISRKVTTKKEDADLVSAWKNNELIFRDTPVKDVIKSLESWYGVNITIDQKIVGEHNYTLKVKTESLREVLDMLKLITPFDYSINGKDILIKYNTN